MAVVSDLKRRTGVGAGGIMLYVVCVAAGVAIAGAYGQADWSDGNPLIFLSGLLYALGLLGIVSAVSNFPRLLLVSVGRHRDATAGLSALTGTVETTAGTLTAPLHDTPAVCYTYRILDNGIDANEESDENADGDEDIDEENWSLAAMGEDGVEFAVTTEGGDRVRVNPTDAAYHIDDRTEVRVGVDETPTAEPDALRRAADIAPAPSGTARRYQEATLKPGDEAFVLGRVTADGGPVIDDGTPFVVADADYPSRLRERVTAGLVLGLPVSLLGFAALLFAAGAL